MRILLISPLSPPIGGIAVWTELYRSYMSDNRNIVDIVNTAVIGKRKKEVSKVNLFEELVRALRIFINTIKFLYKHKYDVIHFNISCERNGLIRDNIIFSIISHTNSKIVLHCHCNIENAIYKYSKLFQNMLNRSTAVFVLNKASKDYLYREYNIESIIVPNFINNVYKMFAKHAKLNKPTIETILYVGHIQSSKGCDTIIKVARYFPKIKFRLVGHLYPEIRKITKPSNIILVGEVSRENIINEYKMADIFIFPSHTEGFPLAVLEAMSFGLPIIATRVGAIPDMLEEKGGIFVSIDDVNDVRRAIDAIDSVQIRKKMSEFNQQKVLSSYCIDKVLDKICDSYKSK